MDTRTETKERDAVSLSEQRALLIEDIRSRVAVLRARSSLILAAIGASLMVAAAVVIFAGRLTSIDAQAVSKTDNIKRDLAASYDRISELNVHKEYSIVDEIRDVLSRVWLSVEAGERTSPSGASPNSPPGSPAVSGPDLKVMSHQYQDLDNKISKLAEAFRQSRPGQLVTGASLERLTSLELDRIKALYEALNEAQKKEATAEQGYSDWRYIVATAITRVGVVLIIVFLVQILMGLYRYNTRLIAFYHTRQDLLSVWDGNPKTLKALHEIISAPKVDFGKEPKHPLEDVLITLGAKIDSVLPKSDKGRAEPPSR